MKFAVQVDVDMDDKPPGFPFVLVGYRIEYQAATYAIYGLHWIMRAWWKRWYPLWLVSQAKWWHTPPGITLRGGHFCTPWSECRRKEIKNRIESQYRLGLMDGRREEREAQKSHFEQYMAEMEREREERHNLDNGI